MAESQTKIIDYSLESLDHICNFYEQQLKPILTSRCKGTIVTDHSVSIERGVRLEITFRVRGALLLANTGNEFTVLVSAFGKPGFGKSLTLIKPFIPMQHIIDHARTGLLGAYEKYTPLNCPFTMNSICTLDYVNSLELEIAKYMQTPHTFSPIREKE